MSDPALVKNKLRVVPGSVKYPAKVNRMLKSLVEYLEARWQEGAFEREYVSVPHQGHA